MRALNEQSLAASRNLVDAIRAAKIAAADRDDGLVDIKEADIARLEVLAQELGPVFDAVPQDGSLWDFAISSGLQPRLWIDATAHVTMGRDRRTYRFQRDTRRGRIVVAEDSDPKVIADAVTAYIADRLVERARIMEGDVVAAGEKTTTIAGKTLIEQTRIDYCLSALIWFLLGVVGASLVLFLLFGERFIALFA
ncbi:hypothetical protein ACFO1V_10925 [Daeguia caeni]|uniref:Uncharacterized protein n=1 Tax=Daeguia caeni TaxID=439612 RepID=A0ABV9H778_9HYPH